MWLGVEGTCNETMTRLDFLLLSRLLRWSRWFFKPQIRLSLAPPQNIHQSLTACFIPSVQATNVGVDVCPEWHIKSGVAQTSSSRLGFLLKLLLLNHLLLCSHLGCQRKMCRWSPQQVCGRFYCEYCFGIWSLMVPLSWTRVSLFRFRKPASIMSNQAFHPPWIPLRIKKKKERMSSGRGIFNSCRSSVRDCALVNEWRRSREGSADGAGGGCDLKYKNVLHSQPFSSLNMNGEAWEDKSVTALLKSAQEDAHGVRGEFWRKFQSERTSLGSNGWRCA